jgi:ABC-type multidrug transport system permease subunit
MGRLDEIRELTRVRILSFLREPEAIFWVFVFPLVLAAVLGFAFRSGSIEPSKVAVVDGPGTEAMLEILASDEHLEAEVFADREEAENKLRRAAVDGLVVPGDPPRLSFDPVRPEAATARLRVQRALALAVEGAVEPPLDLEPVTETGSRYVDFLFPGLIGMNLMGTGMWGIGFAIADVRRRKLLKRLLVTPMRRSSFFLSFMLSRLVFLLLELVVLVGIGCWLLGVPFRGDFISFLVVTLLGAMTFAGLGILVASRARTIEGVSGLMNFVMMPMWLASGVFFSYERFPDFTHPFLRLLPLTGLNDALRAVMLDGESIVQQGPEVLVMVGWCVLTFVVALKIFRWE